MRRQVVLSMGWVCFLGLLPGCGDDKESKKDDAAVTRDAGADAADTGDSNTLLIDDCDDGDSTNDLDGIWLTYNDAHDPAEGISEVWPEGWFQDGEFTMSEPGYGGKGFAARFKGTTATKLGWDYVGMGVSLGPSSYCPEPTPADIDLRAYTGLRFMAKGSVEGGPLVVKIVHVKDGADDNCNDNRLTGDTLTSWVDYAADFSDRLSAEWTEISLDFRKDFFGPNSVDIETVLTHAKDFHFFFQTTNGGEVDLWVDDLSLYREEKAEEDTDDGIDRSGEPETLEDPDDDEAAPLFDRTAVAEVRLTLPPETWDALLENATAEQYTPADVAINGESLTEVGLRFKGSYGSLYDCFDDEGALLCDKLSMKIKFNEYVDEQRFMGLKRLNLHSLRHDTTKMRDCISYDLFRESDIVTPRCSYAFVFVNDEPLGLYGMMEQIDGRFTNSRFSNGDGNLYKEAWPDSTIPSYFTDHLKTNEETPDHLAFMTFAREMMAATDDTLSAVLEQWVDMDYLMRYTAVDFAIANWDGFTTFYCGVDWPCVNHNFYFYQEEERPFFWLIPWDLEATLYTEHWLGDIEPWDNLDAKCEDIPFAPGAEHYIRPAGCDQTFRAIALADRTVYRKTLEMLLAGPMSEAVMLEKVNALSELIEPYIEADPDLDVDTWLSDVEFQITEFDRVRARIEAEIAD